MLYDDKDPYHVARIIDAIVSDGALVERIVAAQDAALDRLLAKDFGGTLLRFVDQVAQAPAQAQRRAWRSTSGISTRQQDRLEESGSRAAGGVPGPAEGAESGNRRNPS